VITRADRTGGALTARDVYRYINELDETTVRAVVDRLEFRGCDAFFTAMREAYFDRLPLASARPSARSRRRYRRGDARACQAGRVR